MSGFVLTAQAELDLDSIWLYIARDNVDAADDVRDDIHAAIIKLSEMPGMGHTRKDLTDKPLRFWPVHSYLIVYREAGDHIEIVRVLSGYRDVGKILQ